MLRVVKGLAANPIDMARDGAAGVILVKTSVGDFKKWINNLSEKSLENCYSEKEKD